MKQYTGTKTVKATPAVRKAGKVYLPEDVIPEGPEPQENGYKVVYPDGYESWSPKEVFESAYQVSETFVDRLCIEGDELAHKIEKGVGFMRSEAFMDLPSQQRILLHNQINAMSLYMDALTKRLALNNGLDCSTSMTFGQAIEALKRGVAIAREGWNGKGMFVIKQVPARIDREIILNMQSLTYQAKELILANKGIINYNNQCLIYNSNTGNADSWVPSISDVFAEDWMIVE